MIAGFERYTGLTYGTDTEFAEAAATIGAQTGPTFDRTMPALLTRS